MTAARDEDVTRAHVARGAGLATLARLGALVEVIAQPAYTWLYGIATYGVYTVMWAAVNIVENIIDLSLTQGLQRVVPTSSEEDAHGAVKFALLVALAPAIVLAMGVCLFAPQVAGLISAAPADRAMLPAAIGLFAWTLPLWTFVEVATSAARARRAFGPEIRLRIFWEQVARLLFAVGFFAAGAGSLGLMLAHLASLTMTAILSGRLLARFYDPELLIAAPMRGPMRRALLAISLSTLPGSISRRLFNDLPAIILNVMLPGTQGANAAGLFGIARKIGSLPMMVRQAFQYVLAPLASAQAARDKAGIAPLYRFSTRVSTALVVPLAGTLILIAPDILSLFAPEAMAALPLLVILVAGRAGEAVVGAATPVIEMTAHRALPLANALLGMAVWGVLVLWLVPSLGGVGMAVAVAVGTIVIAWSAALELRLITGLVVFDRKVIAALATALAGVGLMWLAGLALHPWGARARAITLLMLMPAAMWTALRVGLDTEDRGALGKAGRTLRLV